MVFFFDMREEMSAQSVAVWRLSATTPQQHHHPDKPAKRLCSNCLGCLSCFSCSGCFSLFKLHYQLVLGCFMLFVLSIKNSIYHNRFKMFKRVCVLRYVVLCCFKLILLVPNCFDFWVVLGFSSCS